MIRVRLARARAHYLRWRISRAQRVMLGHDTYVSNCRFEGNNRIGDRCSLTDCRIGAGSYVSFNGILNKVRIGRYCSVASDLRAGLGTHPASGFASTHPAFYYDTRRQLPFTFHRGTTPAFAPHKFVTPEYIVEIGNDVWIGTGVILADGISIGDGAVIGAGSVVLHDVAPYTVVAGVPAKPVRKRFAEEQIELLLSYKWWDKEESWIREHYRNFHDVETFCIWIAGQ